MSQLPDWGTKEFPTWCPGCGDYSIWNALKRALVELGREPHNSVLVGGIGCSGKVPYWVNSYAFNGLHGRPLPAALGIKAANSSLEVIAIGGDGDGYGEGTNHFVHACRRNSDIAYFVHNNMVYGLTTGQHAPTSQRGFKAKSAPEGTTEPSLNPIAVAIASGATFVARGFAGDIPHLSSLMVRAVKHRGFGYVDILQPCVTFNHVNTFDYYIKRVYKLEEKGWDASDKAAAFEKTLEWNDKIPIGVFYRESRETFEDGFPQIGKAPLAELPCEKRGISGLLKEFE